MPSNCVIICDARTGSDLLGLSLGSHSNVSYAGEILCSAVLSIPKHGIYYSESIGLDLTGINELSNKNRLELASSNYINYILKHYNLFKLLYYHLEENQKLIQYLIDLDINIIHLTRNSQVNKYISYMIALRDEFQYKRTPPKKEPIYIDINNFVEYMYKSIDLQNTWRNRLIARKNKSVMFLKYEDLILDWDKHIKECQSFIGLPYLKLDMQTNRAITNNHIELVLNKEELLETIHKYNFQEYL